MEAVGKILLVLHFVGLASLLGGFLSQTTSKVKSITNGMLHGALLSLISGIAMVGVRYPLNNQNPESFPLFNNGKISVKFLLVAVILIIGYTSKKKSKVSGESDTPAWATVGLLTLANIVIAVFW